MLIWTTIFFSIAQQLYRLTNMNVGAMGCVLKCGYFIPVPCLISTSVPVVTPQVQALDLMQLEVTWCWLVLWHVCISYCPWYIEQFRSNTSLGQVCGVVLSLRVGGISLSKNCCIPLLFWILWLKSKAFQCNAGHVSSPSAADLECAWQIWFWQHRGKPCL